jgi:hypothetical protein
VLTRALLLFTAVLGSLAVAAARADADSVGTLQVNATLFKRFGPVDCPAGTPATTNCFRDVPFRDDVVPGLGNVTFAPYTLYWDNFGSPCGHVHGQIPILVAGKGEIDLAFAVTGCWTGDAFPPAAVTVSGGSGRYAGASGSGTLEFRVASVSGPLSGSRQVTWAGTLNVPGLVFDTTPPQFAGAKSKALKTRSARGKRVGYSVSATDATDGPVPAACVPRSGSVFRVGRTTVTCKSVDGSGNSASARFVITVKRVRR